LIKTEPHQSGEREHRVGWSHALGREDIDEITVTLDESRVKLGGG
jgi:hypothetical protein